MEYGHGECFTPNFSFNIGQNRIVQMRNHEQDSEPINMRSNQKPSVKNSLDSNTVKSSVIRSSSNPAVMKRITPFSVSQVSPCKPVVINEIVDTNAVSKSTSNTKQSHMNANKRKRKFPPQKQSSSRKRGSSSSEGYSKNLVTKYQGNFNNFRQFPPQNFMGYNYNRNGGNAQKNYLSSFPRDYFYLPSSQVPFYKNSPPWQTNMNWNFTDHRFLYRNNFDSYRYNNFDSGSKLVVPTLPNVTLPKKLGPQSNRRKIRYPFRNIYWTRKRGNNAGSYRRKVVNHQSNCNNYFQKRKPVLPIMDYDYQNYREMKNSESYSSVPARSSIYRPRFNITPYNNLPSQVNFNSYHYNNYYQYKAGNCNSFNPVKSYFELDQSSNSYYDNYNRDGSYFYHNKPALASFSNQSLFTRSPLFGPPMRGSRQKNISHKGSHH